MKTAVNCQDELANAFMRHIHNEIHLISGDGYPLSWIRLGDGEGSKCLEKLRAARPGRRIARGVVLFASEDGGFVTGSTLSINGGQHMY